MADTSFSDPGAPDNRGGAAHEVIMDSQTGDCRIHGVLSDGTRVDFFTSDPLIGRELDLVSTEAVRRSVVRQGFLEWFCRVHCVCVCVRVCVHTFVR